MRLSKRRALITGASQGFGLAVAHAFVEEGADVMLCARGAERLDQAQRQLSELSKGNTRVLAVQADVSEPDDVQRLVSAALVQLGGLDVLVCNAGVLDPKD